MQWIKLNHKCLKNVPIQIELKFILQKINKLEIKNNIEILKK